MTIKDFIYLCIIAFLLLYIRDKNVAKPTQCNEQIRTYLIENIVDDYAAQYVIFDYIIDDRDYPEDNLELVTETDELVGYLYIDEELNIVITNSEGVQIN